MIKRVFTTKKAAYDVFGKNLKEDFLNVLSIKASDCKEFVMYDIEDLEDKFYQAAKNTIFSEAPVDDIYEDELPKLDDYKIFLVEYLKGQYDQRADSASQCVQLLTGGIRPLISCAKVYAIKGVSGEQLEKIKNYVVNPVESKIGTLEKKITLKYEVTPPKMVEDVENFNSMDDTQIQAFYLQSSFAMTLKDLQFVQSYFIKENRLPTVTELKVIDTYWSDHCRHTTFNTELKTIEIESDNQHIFNALNLYDNLYEEFNSKREDKHKCLMDIAVIGVKKLKQLGKLDNLDISDEINACSVEVDVDVNGENQKWLIMFKNETHNHPTEIEPFGGAATCLGGAIRDPLSGRTYVYQAMRITGAGDPTVLLENTLVGKLPQRVITKTAAAGFASYGNQIGLATGTVNELYHSNYQAKRLEAGYVIGGAPKENIVRAKPQKGDMIVLLGGETGRDGCGGATGSSKAHTEQSVEGCAAEVQKGNPLTERKIQRLFRKPEVSKLIIKCNDFGAGGVAVAIGELADSLDIFLDKVPKKYEGLDGTELAISESQERMAVVLKPNTVDTFIALAKEENLNAVCVAEVTDNGKMRMFLNSKIIVDLKRSFLDTNGVKQEASAKIVDKEIDYISAEDKKIIEISKKDVKKAILSDLQRLNVCSQKGLSERFDSTIGAGSVLMPFGGKYQLTPSIVMASKPPVNGFTDTATVSSFGCPINLLALSPFTGSVYSILLSVNKLISCGVPLSTIRLSLQEFFKKLRTEPERWGEPTSALLGALYAQIGLGVGAIGGKDSMSGSFNELDVPPTVISFAMGITKASKLITNVFKEGQKIYRISLNRDKNFIPDFKYLIKLYNVINMNIEMKNIDSATIVEQDIATSIVKSIIGDGLGFSFARVSKETFMPYYGDFLVSIKDMQTFGNMVEAEYVGIVDDSGLLRGSDFEISHEEMVKAFTETLENVFKTTAKADGVAPNLDFVSKNVYVSNSKFAMPKIFIPTFPGTNCEYDTARAFKRAKGDPSVVIVKNQNANDISETIKAFRKEIDNAQIIAFPGGFSGGDEPDGSGKFIATTFRNPIIKDAINELLYKRDGLIIGICNGFQALVKLGLVPYGKIIEQKEEAPTLTFNNINRHVSTIARIRVASNISPWLSAAKVGDVFAVPVSHGEGRFVANEEELNKIIINGQVATQYVDLINTATMVSPFNPNGSMYAIEGITSIDGRVFGKMGHAERIDANLYKNVQDNYDMKIFESGINYFK